MIKEILSKMTLEEKIALCSGKNFWETKENGERGIPALFMCDGPHGLRKQESEADMLGVNRSRSATCFPAEVTTADSWDTELMEKIGAAIADEARNQNVGLVLGPGVNIKRNPLCGRNFEYFSEDPHLAGKLAAAFIKGAEGRGVATSLKHFACNSQETDRFVSDSVIDERTLREIYLPSFETAVKEGKPSTLMCAYPKLNGTHCSDSKYLLTDILRNEWGFDGAVITDWGAMKDRIEGFRAGCDLSMPGGSAFMEKETIEAVRSGRLSEEDVDRCAERVLRLILRGHEAMSGEECDYDLHDLLAEEAAISGAVLLKNDDGLLPLDRNGSIAVIGCMAKHMRYQGSGSSHINPVKLSEPCDSIPFGVYAEGFDDRGDTTDEMTAEAVKAALGADAAVIFAGLPDRYESEGFDRTSMKMPEGTVKVIEKVSEANRNTVVVLFCGSAVECPWADNVKSVLYMGLPGQAGGRAVSKLIFGDACPSGRLAESWPYSYVDVPSSEIFGKTRDALYMEGIYVGYRYYDKADVPVRFSFGHGLSYTGFTYSDISLDGDILSVTVTNTGGRDGAEVVQLYIEPPQDGIHRPVKELKGFTKVFLEADESLRTGFRLDDRCFSVWQDGWKVPSGSYKITVGDLSLSVTKEGGAVSVPSWQNGSWYETLHGKPVKEEWDRLTGHVYTKPSPPAKGSYTMENTVEEMKERSLIMKIMYKVTERILLKGLGTNDREDPEFRMMLRSSVGGPLRSMYISGGVQGGVFPGLLEMANGHFLKGIIRMIKG